jgi:hypothetical protein
MGLPRKRSPRKSPGRRAALLSALGLGWIMASVGCQVEYAGMTLPTGRYMHDDVQYFPSGPDFPWANTQAATQRARMRAMGIEPPPPPGAVPAAPGSLEPGQSGPRGPNVNTMPMPPLPGQPVTPQPVPAGAGGVPAVPAPAGVPVPPATGVPAPTPAPPAPGGAAPPPANPSTGP